jgi:hypothetical protein
MEKQYKIYRLILDEKTVYIGQTTNKYLSQRKALHNHRNIFEGVKESKIELIEVTADKSRERFWIEKYIEEGYILFNKNRGISGLTGKESKKLWNLENKDKVKEISKKYRQTEERKQYMKEYREENKEYKKELDKKYYKNNKDKIKEYHKEYQKTEKYKEYQKEYKRQLRAKKKLEKNENNFVK